MAKINCGLEAQKFKLSPSAGYRPNQKIEFFRPSPDPRSHIGEKGIFNRFYTNFTGDFACDVHFQLHDHDLFEKS